MAVLSAWKRGEGDGFYAGRDARIEPEKIRRIKRCGMGKDPTCGETYPARDGPSINFRAITAIFTL
jgi:hypothetical protein